MRIQVTLRVVLALVALAISGRSSFSQEARLLQPGDPMPGLTAQETQIFRQGQETFMEVLGPEQGLGPAFNGTSCAGCHSAPAVGGSSSVTVVRAGRRDEDGKFRELAGTSLFQMSSTPDYRCQVHIPADANVIARRLSSPVFGLGLIEAIRDDTLLDLADQENRSQDGVHGRVSLITDVASGQRRVGRFGWKAQHATLLSFAADAYRGEMGITNELFPEELAAGVDPQQMKLCDLLPDPEDVRDRKTGLRAIDKLDAFLKYLAPLERGPVNDTVRAGEALFAWAGCASCHAPALTTGVSSNPLFDRRPVPLYSDLLLHDLYAGDGIEQASATGSEIRTTPLWGLRFRRPLWHDGASATAHDAILRHGGDGEAARGKYLSLDPQQQAVLQAFLMSL